MAMRNVFAAAAIAAAWHAENGKGAHAYVLRRTFNRHAALAAWAWVKQAWAMQGTKVVKEACHG